MSDPVLTECPECSKDTFKKQLSAPNFRLKGAGWYETDFKTGDKKNLATSDDSQGGKSAESSGSDTASNTETKTSESKSSEAKEFESKPAAEKKPGKPDTGKSAPKASSSDG